MKRILLLLSMFLFIASVEAWIPRAPARSQLEYNYVPPTSYVPCNNPQPCAAPCNSTCNNLPCWDWLGLNGVYGQFLWWNIYGDQLDWAREAIITTTLAAPVITTTSATNTFTHKFDFAPGFRLGFNHIFPCTENDLSLVWTYYWNSNSASHSALASGTPAIRLSSPYLNTPPAAVFAAPVDQTISSAMNFRLNRVDLTFGQNVQPWDCVVVNYYGGAVFWQTRENLNIDSNYIITQFGSLAQHENIQTDYRGAGAQVGGRLNWNIINSLVFSANAALAGTVGDYTQNVTLDSLFVTPIGAIIPNFTTFDTNARGPLSYWTTRVAASVGLSLRYSLCFWNQWMAYTDIGWEYHHYFNQTAFQVNPAGSISDSDPGQTFTRSPADLAVHGLTLTFGVTF